MKSYVRLQPMKEGQRSDDYNEDNFLDTGTPEAWREHHYRHLHQRIETLLKAEQVFAGGGDRRLRVLSVGCGADARASVPPGPNFYVIGCDTSKDQLEQARALRNADEIHLRPATDLPVEDGSIDVLLYRFVLHHLVDQGPLAPVFREAHRVLRPGGKLVALEPNLFNPIGFCLFVANHLKLSKQIMGTSDDWPLSPRMLARELGAFGFESRMLGIEYGWRRLPIGVQDFLKTFDSLGSVPGLKYASHTFMTIATKR